MAYGERELLALLDRIGIAHQTSYHPPLHTVEESRALRGDLPGAHCKTLFLRDARQRYVLAVIAEDRRLDVKGLQRALAPACGRLSFASAEELERILGVRPGSVTPFALVNANRTGAEIIVVIDRDVMAAEEVNFHPLHNAATTRIASRDLPAFIEHCGYAPRILDFSAL